MQITDLFERDLDPSAQARAFAAWFRGSKVVNPDGTPKKMYHGTRMGDIEAFDPDRASPTALYGPGIYFTDSPNVAGGTGDGKDEEDIHWKAAFNLAGYAFQAPEYDLQQPLTKRQMAHAKRLFLGREVDRECREDIGSRRNWQAGWKAFQAGEPEFRLWLAKHGPRWFRDRLKTDRVRTTRPTVYPVYLRIVNPFIVEQPVGMDFLRMLWDAVPDHHETFENASSGMRLSRGLTAGDAWEWMVARVFGNYNGDGKVQMNKLLRTLGYDGIHHRGGRVIATMGEHDVWIAFSPEQIKSVFAQSFDASSPRLSEERD